MLLTFSTDLAFFTTLSSVLLGGGVSFFRPWVKDEETFKKDIRLQRETSKEIVADSFDTLLRIAIETGKPIRRDGTSAQDLVYDHISLAMKHFDICRKLGTMMDRVRSSYSYLLTTTIAGLFVLVMAAGLPNTRPAAAWFGLVLLALEVHLVCCLRSYDKQLASFEEGGA